MFAKFTDWKIFYLVQPMPTLTRDSNVFVRTNQYWCRYWLPNVTFSLMHTKWCLVKWCPGAFRNIWQWVSLYISLNRKNKIFRSTWPSMVANPWKPKGVYSISCLFIIDTAFLLLCTVNSTMYISMANDSYQNSLIHVTVESPDTAAHCLHLPGT